MDSVERAELKPTRWEYTIWALILILAAGMFLFRNTHESVWYDEACTYATVTHPIWEVWGLVAGDFHPPLYFVMLSIFTKIFGSSIFVLRAFSAIGVLATALLGFGPVRRLLGARVGLLFSFLISIAPISLVFAQETRMYSWACFWTTAAICYAVLGATVGKKKDWVLYGVCFLGAIYTHFYGLLAMITLNSLLLIWIFLKRKDQLKPYLVLISVVMIGYVPWLASMLGQVNRVINHYWIQPITIIDLWRVLSLPFSFKFTSAFLTPVPFLVTIILIGLGILKAKNSIKSERTMIYITSGTYILTILFAVIISVIIRPILVPRYVMTLIGVFFLPAAYGLSKIRERSWKVFCLLVITAFSFAIRFDIYRYQFNGPSPAQFAEFKKELRPDDVIVCLDETAMGVFYYYFSENEIIFTKNEETSLFANHKVFVPTITVYSKTANIFEEYYGKRIWLVGSLFRVHNIKGESMREPSRFKGPKRIIESPMGYVKLEVFKKG